MDERTKAYLLHRDHIAQRRRYLPQSPERKPFLTAKKLLLIAAFAGSLLFPQKALETLQTATSLPNAIIFGDVNYLNTDQSSKAHTLPLFFNQRNPTERIPIAVALIDDAIEIDKPQKKIGAATKTLLARHILNLENIVFTLQQLKTEGGHASYQTIADHLITIDSAQKYFKTKELPSLLPITELAQEEILHSTPTQTLIEAKRLLQKAQLLVIPPVKPIQKTVTSPSIHSM